MKYYKIAIRSFYGDRIVSSANFINNLNENYFKKIGDGEIIIDAPIFDYFFLESFDKKKYWDWKLFDVHPFIGESSSMLGSLLISKRAKTIFDKFNISNPHYFYSSNLIFENDKYDYFIFQFTGKLLFKELAKYISFSKSEFLNPALKTLVSFKNIDDYIEKSEELYFEKDIDFVKKKIVLNEKLDYFPMQSFFIDNIVSENLKEAIEENNITGFEFSELDYEIIIDPSPDSPSIK
ncbi:hypothetical protein [Flavobacterium covae]|uniref:hypothetical protein n=1 Tax=Flavobacterium covae TaxID=2906076 RepID=UPI003390A774